jgi:hypothetical protein
MAEKVIGFKIQIEGLAGTIETATQLKRQIAELNSELKKTADVDEIKKLEKKLVDLKAAQSLVNDVTREQIKLRKEEIAGIDKSEGAYRRLSKELNDQRKRYKDLAASEQESSQEARDLIVSITALDKKLKGIDATVGQFQRNVGGYTEALGQFFPKLGGTLGQVSGVIGGLSQGITGLSATTGAFNKSLGAIGIALTVFSGISEIFQSINESVAETKELSNQVGAFTGATGNVLSDFVSKSKAISTTYKKDVNEITVAANSASKALGISFSEALDAVEIGFRKGADSNGLFLDNLREYPTQFAAAGLSIKDYLAVAISASNQGIYSDKGLDVVKEFGLRIREQTKTSKDALIGAFGEEFTGELFENLNNGSITTAEALARVSNKMGDTSVAGNKLQTVIADVFGAPGEDAGLAYILSLEKILKNTDEVTKSTNKYQTQQEILFQTNLDLEQSQSELNESFTKFGGEFTIISSKAKIFFNNLLGGLIDLANEFPATLKAMGAGLTTFFTTGSISQALKVNRDVFRAEKQKIDKEDKLAIEKAEKDRIALEKQNAEEQKKRLRAQNKELSTAAYKGGQEAGKEYAEGSIAALENERGKLQSAFSNAVVGSGTQKELAVKLNEVNAQIKTAVDTQNEILGLNAEKKKADAIEEINQNFKVAQSVISLARAKETTSEDEIENINQRRIVLDNDYNAEVQRINALIALEATGSKEVENLLIERRAAEANYIKGKEGLEKQEKGINDKRVASEKSFYDKINKLQIDGIKDNQEREIAAAKQKGIDDLDNLNKELDLIFASETEKARLRKLLTDKTEQEIKDIQDKYKKEKEEDEEDERRKLREAIANGISEIINFVGIIQKNANDKASEIVLQNIENTEANIEELQAKAEKASGLRKKRIEKDIVAQNELLKRQQAEAEELRIKGAKEEKRIAIIQAIIQGALGISRALASAKIPINFINAAAVGIATGAQIATIAAQPLAEGGVVTGQRVNQKQNIPTRSNGDNVLAYVKRGEVVLNQRQQSLLGGSPTFRRIGIKGFAEGGMVPPISAPIQALSGNNDLSNFLQVIEAKTDAINNRIDRLQAYVVSDDIARDLAEGNKLKVKATL